MRFILALVPHKAMIPTYLQAAQSLFSEVAEGYLLSENSSPHITLGQFECKREEEAAAIWAEIERLGSGPFSPRFTGVSFVLGVGAHSGYYWAELSVAREEEIMGRHHQVASLIRSNGLTCLNESDNLYRPHLTLARIRLPSSIPRWPEPLLNQPMHFRIALALGDEMGQYKRTLFEVTET